MTSISFFISLMLVTLEHFQDTEDSFLFAPPLDHCCPQGRNSNASVESLCSFISHSVVFASLTLFSPPHAKDNSFYSSSDSEDEDEPRKFHVEIKPVQPNNGTHQSRATIDELKASIGNIILSPSTSVQLIAPNAESPPTQTCCSPARELHEPALLVNTRGQQ